MPPTRFQGTKSINASGANVIDRTSPLLMDGSISVGVQNIPLNNTYTLTNGVVTRNAAGDVSINVPVSVTANINFLLGEYFKQATSLLSTTSVPALNNSGLLADGSGDTPLAKGSLISNIILAYSTQGGPLTSFTAGVWLNVFSNGVANALSNPIPQAQGGLLLANTPNATTCNVTLLPIVIGNQSYDSFAASSPTLELAVVTPAGCTFRLYNVALQLTYNYL